MCAIAGYVNALYDSSKILESLYHRGPDDQTKVTIKNVTLLHTRLAIQDIKEGGQPFSFNGHTIIFNGEIYNHLELRETLSEFDFQTRSDTETLLYLYIKYREKMFEKIDGMFAFVILDEKKNQLFLARDRAGKKPLYLYKEGETLLFASELNAIKAVACPRVDDEALYAYIRTGLFFKSRTPYYGLKEVEAGSFYTFDLKSMEMKKSRYFDLLPLYQKEKIESFDASLFAVEEALNQSVKSRLISSDLEVGAFLSGGIDSSLIVALASQHQNRLKTFTVRSQGGYDESKLAKLTAEKYGTEHHELAISLNLKEDIETILKAYGEPFMDSSAIPSYYVSQEAKKHVTVILNGDGADELFAGYRRYVPVANGWIKQARRLSFLTKILPSPHTKQSLYNYAYRLLRMSHKTGLDFYLSSRGDVFEDAYRFKSNSFIEEMENFIEGVELSGLDRELYLDFEILLFSDLLVKMDIATMAHSLEGRSPFLSTSMLETAPLIKDSYKINGKTTKYLLRELAKKYLPSAIITQPKRGFEVPLKKWVDGELKEPIFDALSKQSEASRFISQSFITKLLEKRVTISDEKRAKMLWNIYSLEVWRRGQ